jgi:hypothetical protein
LMNLMEIQCQKSKLNMKAVKMKMCEKINI